MQQIVRLSRLLSFGWRLRPGKRRLAAAIVMAGFVMAGVAMAPLPVASQQTLVLNDVGGAPYTNASRDGFLDIVVKAAFGRIGLGLKLIRLPAERGLLNANAGIDDGDLSRVAGLEKIYRNLIPVPEKLLDYNFVAFTRNPRIQIKNWQSLRPYSVGFIKGWKILEKNVPRGTRVTLAKGPQQLFAILHKGRVDIVLYEAALGLEIVRRRRLEGVRVLKPPLATRPMFIYLHKKHRRLVPVIAGALADIKAEGFYKRAYQKTVARLLAQE